MYKTGRIFRSVMCIPRRAACFACARAPFRRRVSMKNWKKAAAAVISAAMLCTGSAVMYSPAGAAESAVSEYDWGTVRIGGGGFVSGIITGQKAMYARTDVGGAYRYDYEKREWVQLMDFVNDSDRGFLSIDALCIDPTDDNTIYVLAGCAYFSAERTAIFKAVSEGYRSFSKIAVIAKDGSTAYPCGICLQVMHEFMPDGVVVLEKDGRIVTYTLKDLLHLTNEEVFEFFGIALRIV